MIHDGGAAIAHPGTSVWLGDHGPRYTTREWTAPASALLPSQWLDGIWREASGQRRQAVWDALPDRIGDAAEAHRITTADIAFLRDRSADRSGTMYAAAAALRALGRICEDDRRWIHDALPAFLLALRAPSAGLRFAAAEAIWQARAIQAWPALAAAAQTERDETVRATMEHVLHILR